LAQAGTGFAYDASKLNQAATLAALQGNQQAANVAAQIRNQALQVAPGTAAVLPNVQQPFLEDLLRSVLSGTQQTQGATLPGTSGILPSLLQAGGTALGGALGGPLGAAAAAGLSNLFSPTTPFLPSGSV
jgi:hypothetical protein